MSKKRDTKLWFRKGNLLGSGMQDGLSWGVARKVLVRESWEMGLEVITVVQVLLRK